MSISSTTRQAGPFSGNDSASAFPFAFKVFTASDLSVVQSDGTTETTLTLDSDYAVVLNDDQNANPGGTVTLMDYSVEPAVALSLASGQTLVVSSAVAQLQATELTNGGAFYPEVLTDALDRLTILVQQQQVQLNRAVAYPVSESVTAALPPAEVRANKFLYFDADGNPVYLQAGPAGVALFAGALSGTKNGANCVFTLMNGSFALGKTPAQVTVWQNYPLVQGVGYTLGPLPGQVTFTAAPAADDTLFAQGAYQA